MKRKLVLSLMVLVSLAMSAQAAEPFIALVDEERGLLLIPEGTAIPMGVDFHFTRDDIAGKNAAPRSLLTDAISEEGVAPRRLVYAYAAPEKFAEARRKIAEVEAKMADPALDSVMRLVEEDGSPHPAGVWKGATIYAGTARSSSVASLYSTILAM